MAKLLICELHDKDTRARFWTAVKILGAVEIEELHWSDVGVEHWSFQIGSDELMVFEDYGELIVKGPPAILRLFHDLISRRGDSNVSSK